MLMLACPIDYTRINSYPTPTVSISAEAGEVDARFRNALEHLTSSISAQSDQQRFAVLSATWKEDMKFSSSIHDLLSNPAYLSIIALGKKALPLILSDLKNSHDQWFVALNVITGFDPVDDSEKGDVRAMSAAWIRWGQQNGYV